MWQHLYPPNSEGLLYFRLSDSDQQLDLGVSQWESALEGVLLPLPLLKDKLHLAYDLARAVTVESLLWMLCRVQGPLLIEAKLLSPVEVPWARKFPECF